jgi:type 1 glutamine amidotransferase
MTDKTNLTADGVRPTDKDIPISWLRTYGKGRLFYCSFGENHHIFSNPVILQHYLDGIQFVLGDLSANTMPLAAPN